MTAVSGGMTSGLRDHSPLCRPMLQDEICAGDGGGVKCLTPPPQTFDSKRRNFRVKGFKHQWKSLYKYGVSVEI